MAWPVSTLVIVLLFKHDVTQALGRLGRFKYRDLEMTFREDLRQAEELARTIPPPAPAKAAVVLEIESGEGEALSGRLIGVTTPRALAADESREGLIKLAVRSPRESVEQAWTIVGQALIKMAMSMGERRLAATSNPDLALRFLVERGCVTRPEAMLVGLLRNLRDRSAQDPKAPAVEDAQRFVELAFRVTARLQDQD